MMGIICSIGFTVWMQTAIVCYTPCIIANSVSYIVVNQLVPIPVPVAQKPPVLVNKGRPLTTTECCSGRI